MSDMTRHQSENLEKLVTAICRRVHPQFDPEERCLNGIRPVTDVDRFDTYAHDMLDVLTAIYHDSRSATEPTIHGLRAGIAPLLMTTTPQFKPGVRALAELFERALDPKLLGRLNLNRDCTEDEIELMAEEMVGRHRTRHVPSRGDRRGIGG